VRKVAERHHGRVWAESEPGKGSTFFLSLPTTTEGDP
jgi:signal transduction histidine kinase